jgi:hypothetical protein
MSAATIAPPHASPVKTREGTSGNFEGGGA